MRIKNILVATFMVLISANIVAEQAPMKIGIVAPDAAVLELNMPKLKSKEPRLIPNLQLLKLNLMDCWRK